jgi:hypothetical protein
MARADPRPLCVTPDLASARFSRPNRKIPQFDVMRIRLTAFAHIAIALGKKVVNGLLRRSNSERAAWPSQDR